MFLGGLLKGGISIKQPMIGIWRPGFSTTPRLRGVGNEPCGLLGVRVVMRLAHCWVLEQQRFTTNVVNGVVPGFPHITESLTIGTLVFVGGGVCGGVVV